MDNHRSSTPPVCSPSLSGPHELYYFQSPAFVPDREYDPYAAATVPDTPLASPPTTELTLADHLNTAASRSALAVDPPRALNSVRSNPALSASKQAGRVKDMANRIDHGQAPLTIVGSRDGSRQLTVSSRHALPGSPRGTSSGSESRKLQKRPRSPRKAPSTSFESSFSSATSSSTVRTTRSQPHAAFSPKRARSPSKHSYLNARPLFGEITADGQWNGNFDLSEYAPPPTYEKMRRGSEGSLALTHGRSQSHQDISAPTLAAPTPRKLSHKRSRSDMDALEPQMAPSMPDLHSQNLPSLYPTPPDSATRATRQKDSPISSRIPTSNRRQSIDSNASSNGYPRAPSAMSNSSGRRRRERSPSRLSSADKETPAVPRSRYHPPTISIDQSGQALSAKIVAPLPKTSPPLRSSRPRQPVSSATTSASRARAAERYQGANPNTMPRDRRRPSEQWLGKPYDPQTERSRRKIPELDQINFEERRARIQDAITQSLKSSESRESMKRSQSRSVSRSSRAPSISASYDRGQQALGSETTTPLYADQDGIADGAGLADGEPRRHDSRARGLSVDTSGVVGASAKGNEPELLTAHTDQTVFEGESPILGRPVAEPDPTPPKAESEVSPLLLTPATYRSHPKTPASDVPTDVPSERVQNPTILEHVLRMRERSESSASRVGTEFAGDSPLANDNPRNLGDKWGLGNGDQGSIRIMLDGGPNIPNHSQPRSMDVEGDFAEAKRHADSGPNVWHGQESGQHAFADNGFTESPIEGSAHFHQDNIETTPRKTTARDDTLRPEIPSSSQDDHTFESDGSIARVLDYYSNTGTLTAEMLAAMQHRVLDLHRLSANGGSDANMIQNLLESIMDSHATQEHTQDRQTVESGTYEVPSVTPDTPPMDDDFEPGTVIVYGSDAQADEEEDFEAKIKKADEEWERQRSGGDTFVAADSEEDKPPPPPKDVGYTPRSSTGPSSATFLPDFNEAGLRISTSGQLDLADVHAAGDRVVMSSSPQLLASSSAMSALSPPSQPPPPPPPPAGVKPSVPSPEVVSGQTFSERGSSEVSSRVHKASWAPSGSSRPSIDSQRAGQHLPASQSMTSFGESTGQASLDNTAEAQARLVKPVSPGPEQKRLSKRRHIMKELLDTENSYHQDLKIIEDIYKATCTPELVAPEDKKVLFGNCDDIERFALHFYDDLRRAAAQVYVPAKQQRWTNNKRSSFSTTQSDGTTQTNTDAVDDEKDRLTTIGRTFLMNIAQMEKVYGAYLKNHEAANQRLSALQSTPTVKCWLDECHANASDITSAWNLDSLLVKPTQRVAKYPMLLKDLLDATPADHPDHEDLQSACKDMVGMLTRTNEAKKRADIVDQIINNKKGRKDSDLRGGFSKAFGRRTEKLKERVGIAEAFQDTEFDELAHKFGGHFIRLQICMRDVQDYVHRADKGIELVNNYVEALELFTDLHDHQLAEIQSKWRRYGQIIRELTLIAFGDHKAAVQKRVLAPMIQCIKLHEGPQAAINKRKKKIVDYAKCKSDERRGMKPDKKTQEASDAYVALNETLKVELPQLYNLTAKLVQNCLHCFLDIQLKWHSTWERKLRPVLEAADIPNSIQQIEPAFRPDFVEVEKSLTQLSICNGTLKLEAANFLSSSATLMEKSEHSSTTKRPSTLDSSNRTMSVGSESSTLANGRRYSGLHSSGAEMHAPLDNRVRSNSSMSNRGSSQTQGPTLSANRPWSNSNTPTSSFSMSRPTTANTPSGGYYPRQSLDSQRSPRPESNATYFTARPEPESQRFSGLFQSAYPPDVGTPQGDPTPARAVPASEDMNVLFVCASLFEFSIDRTRKEAGYPYLQYVQGEVFDVIAQKGELWLAKNQDDPNNELGWIWEQHFIILSSD